MIQLAPNLSINPVEYASQGNAILGIRDSGKSYTATYMAEQLMANNIPIVAFDPIGVWRYLKVGKTGKGFPIVVAGADGDLPLTPESAPNIVRAAMRENVSLVLDLYSIELSKADWKKIVEQCVRLLLYENKNCGLRHIFIEEAAEFCPQRVRPDEGRVYAEIEKLARMGGNASLGYTLINQRAEEVNKAVLELCDCLFLHRQKGRHSLTALGKWLDIADTKNTKQIINSLPSLSQGECWAWKGGSHKPIPVKIPEKQTFHPDRKNPLVEIAPTLTADVSKFVARMQKSLGQLKEEQPSLPIKIKTPSIKSSNMSNANSEKLASEIEIHKRTITALEQDNEELKRKIEVERAEKKDALHKLEMVRKMLLPQYEQLQKIFALTQDFEVDEAESDEKWLVWLNKLSGKNREMLKVLIEKKRLTRQQLGLLSGMSASSGSFNTYLSKLKSLGLVKKDGNEIVLQNF